MIVNYGNFYSPDKIISKLADMKIDEVQKEFNAQVNLCIKLGCHPRTFTKGDN